MAIHLYEDITLTQRISEGDLKNPDDDIYNGTDGEAKDKELFVANEQTIPAAALASGATSLQLSAALHRRRNHYRRRRTDGGDSRAAAGRPSSP